jgi:hypothetical protein
MRGDANAAAIAHQRQRRRRADMRVDCPFPPGQRTHVVREIIAVLTIRSRKACPQTPEPSGASATIEISISRSRLVSSPTPAANRSKLVSGSSKKIAVASKSPLENAPHRPAGTVRPVILHTE